MALIKKNTVLAKRAASFRSAIPVTTLQVIENSAMEEAGAGIATVEDIQARDIQSLLGRIADLENSMQTAEEKFHQERTEAFRRGRIDGAAEAASREKERTDALQRTLDDALSMLGRKIDAERDLAIDIARAVLDRIFGDPDLHAGLVKETARVHAASLQRTSIVSLRVSAVDYPDPGSLALLRSSTAGIKVVADPDLERGACIFNLSLGSLDASIPRQRAALEGVFDRADRLARAK